MSSYPIKKISVAGAGTMGRGIALSAALSGYEVILYDTQESVLTTARKAIEKDIEFLLQKEKITVAEKHRIASTLQYTTNLEDCKAEVIIEAIIEAEDVKVDLFNKLASINSESVIFASNTSSLSIDAIQKRVSNPSRVAGLHFFNPAHVMKLVEVVKGSLTSEQTIEVLLQLCLSLKKTAVLCNDAPGFIVNRVARHYYLESMRLLEKGCASIEDIDKIMEASGFRMGPFKLMDLIGMDINLAVSRSLYEAFHREPRLEPSPIQIDKVNKGELGRKTGKGFYQYS